MSPLPVTMIMIQDIKSAVLVDGKKHVVYNRKVYKPVKRFFNSTDAIQYAHDNRCRLIISITNKDPSRWLVMKRLEEDKANGINGEVDDKT